MSLSSVLDSAEDKKSGFFSLNKVKNTGMLELLNINISHDFNVGICSRFSHHWSSTMLFDRRFVWSGSICYQSWETVILMLMLCMLFIRC